MRTPLFRGCMTQFLGGLDADWASFSEAVERLITLVRSKDGIESVVKNLDGKLSEAIMHAMTNGPELEKKVSNQLDCRDLGIKSAVSSSRNNTLGSRLLTWSRRQTINDLMKFHSFPLNRLKKARVNTAVGVTTQSIMLRCASPWETQCLKNMPRFSSTFFDCVCAIKHARHSLFHVWLMLFVASSQIVFQFYFSFLWELNRTHSTSPFDPRLLVNLAALEGINEFFFMNDSALEA